MKLVLLIEGTQGVRLRLPLTFTQFDSEVKMGVQCRLIDEDAEEHIAMLDIGFDAEELRLYVGPEAEEVWTNVPPHPFAGMSAVADTAAFRAEPTPEEVADGDEAAQDPETLEELGKILGDD